MTIRNAWAAALLTALAASAAFPAEAGCTRTIYNRSNLTAFVSRDGGPQVAIPPRRSQSIRLTHPGRLDVSLACGRGPEAVVYRNSFSYSAIIDRCYFELGYGFFEDQLGPGFFGSRDIKPLTLNNPRQGDVIIGPVVEERCPVLPPYSVRARY